MCHGNSMSNSYIRFFREPSIQPFEIPVESHMEGLRFLGNMQRHMSIPIRSRDLAVFMSEESPIAFSYVISKKNILKSEASLPEIGFIAAKNSGFYGAGKEVVDKTNEYGCAWNSFWRDKSMSFVKLSIADNVGIDKHLIAKVVYDLNSEVFDKNDEPVKYMRSTTREFILNEYKENRRNAAEAILNIEKFCDIYERQGGRSIYDLSEAYSLIPKIWRGAAYRKSYHLFKYNLVRHMATTRMSISQINDIWEKLNKIILRHIKLEMVLERLSSLELHLFR